MCLADTCALYYGCSRCGLEKSIKASASFSGGRLLVDIKVEFSTFMSTPGTPIKKCTSICHTHYNVEVQMDKTLRLNINMFCLLIAHFTISYVLIHLTVEITLLNISLSVVSL